MNDPPKKTGFVGRGSQVNPANRFDSLEFVQEVEDEALSRQRIATQFIPDESKSAVSENHSPDLAFRYSLNPYRGCEHGCSYCYARTYHEYLGYSGGLDFETKIVYKPDIAKHFRNWLARPNWEAEQVAISGATDCYQPAEREFQLTRACLEVASQFGQPVSIVTKNALVLRDLDVLSDMAPRGLIRVYISITSLDQGLTKVLEPRTSSPSARLRALTELAGANVPCGALLSPIIPGLNDCEIPQLLKAVNETGCSYAQSSLLRLPGVVEPVFLDWLRETLPDKAEMIEGRVRQTRNQKLNEIEFGKRMIGEGELAKQINQTFRVFAKKFGLNKKMPSFNFENFRRPGDDQLRLF